MKPKLVVLPSIILASMMALACSSPSPSSNPPKGRGSPACNQWQTAICGWASKCGSPSAATCQDQANSIACISDQKAQDCANAFNSAACTSLPAGCDLRDLADPAPARMACQQFLDELCVAAMRCNPTTTAAQCDQQFASMINCTNAIGVKLTFEQCIADIKVLSCQATSSPPACTGALVSSM